MADPKQTTPASTTSTTSKTDDKATGGNVSTAPAPESQKTGNVPGGADTSETINPPEEAAKPEEPTVQRDFDDDEDVVAKRRMARAMAAGSTDDEEWPKPAKLIRGKHDGISWKTGERISGEAGDGQIFALSKRGAEAFGDKFEIRD